MVNIVESIEEISIIEAKDEESLPAIKVGIVSKAITKISPTTFIAMTMVRDDKTSIKV